MTSPVKSNVYSTPKPPRSQKPPPKPGQRGYSYRNRRHLSAAVAASIAFNRKMADWVASEQQALTVSITAPPQPEARTIT